MFTCRPLNADHPSYVKIFIELTFWPMLFARSASLIFVVIDCVSKSWVRAAISYTVGETWCRFLTAGYCCIGVFVWHCCGGGMGHFFTSGGVRGGIGGGADAGVLCGISIGEL